MNRIPTNRSRMFFSGILLWMISAVDELPLSRRALADGAATPSLVDYSSAFHSTSLTAHEKWDLAKDARGLSADDRRALQQMLSDTDSGDSWYYALTALVAAHDTTSVHRITAELQKKPNRYFALALGHLGDRRAIPALEQVLAETDQEYMRRCTRAALRLLSAKTESLPRLAASRGLAVLELSLSETNVVVGEDFVLRASVNNMGSEAIWTGSHDTFFARSLRIDSEEGLYTVRLPREQVFDLEPPGTALKTVPAKSESVVQETCIVRIERVRYDNWPDQRDGTISFVLRSTEGMWSFDVGPYAPGKELSLNLAVVLKSVQRTLPPGAPMANPLTETDVLVSNTVRLRVSEDSPRLPSTPAR